MPVKELHHLRKHLADGTLLDQRIFQDNMALLLPDATPDAISKWADFAQECVDMKHYVDFKEEPEPVALSRWFDTILAGFVKLTEQFGQETTTQVCALSLSSCALYPYEMELTAEEVQKGTNAETIHDLMIDGMLEAPYPDFPKLREVLADEPQQKPNTEITF